MSLRRGHTVFLSWALNSPASFFYLLPASLWPPHPVPSFLSRHFRPPRLLSSTCVFSPLSLDNTAAAAAAAAAYLSLPHSSFLSLAVFPLPPSFLTSLFAAWTAGGWRGREGGGGVVVKWWVQRGHIPGSLLD